MEKLFAFIDAFPETIDAALMVSQPFRLVSVGATEFDVRVCGQKNESLPVIVVPSVPGEVTEWTDDELKVVCYFFLFFVFVD
jgi:hypothetical protein